MTSGTRRTALLVDAAQKVTARQVAGRVRRLLPPRVLAQGLESGAALEPRPLAAGIGANRPPQSGPTPPPDEVGAFHAVGHTRAVGSKDFWTDLGDGLLFLFHLHGFEQLARYAAGERSAEGDTFWAELVTSWIGTCEKPRQPAWHPYPTSNRIVAWSAALSSITSWPDGLRARLAQELLRQARYLSRTVEHDIGGNHVIRNGLGLATAGSLFPTSGLLTRGLTLLQGETARQVLADGGHEERSTSYHLEVLHDLKDVELLLERMEASIPSWLSDTTDEMTHWVGRMRGPDLRLPLLNDAWEAPSAPEREIEPVTVLPESGYVVLREGGDQVVFDCGPLSPPHLPPHAHADALSFVLWADGEQVIVDPGSYTYTGDRRDEFRATRAHNTVEVDGEDQCVFWGDFRLGFAPNVESRPLRSHEDVLIASASHDGYTRLSRPVRHCRSLIWWPPHGAVVVDLLRGSGRHEIRSRLHLAPRQENGLPGRAGPLELRPLADRMKVTRLAGAYAPHIGKMLPAPVVEASGTVEPEVPFGWSLLRPSAEVTEIDRERVVLRTGERTLTVPLAWN